MKSIEEAFLADVLADPFDDAPRLIFADWQEEHGGEWGPLRAAFIRGGILYPKGTRPTAIFREKDGRYEGTHSPDLIGWQPLPVIPGATLTEGRGWIESVKATTGSLRVGEKGIGQISWEFYALKDLCAVQPITDVRVTDVENGLHREPAGWHWLKDYVPPGLYGRLTGLEMRARFAAFPRALRAVRYDTEADALADLSHAAVDLGRHLAGLPRIDWNRQRVRVPDPVAM